MINLKKSVPYRDYLLLDMNIVVRSLVLSDVVWMSAIGMLGPVFALFIEDYIEGGNAATAGTAAAIYLIAKSVFQIPVAGWIDRIRGEKDDFWLMWGGSIIAALVPILYLFIHTAAQLYVIQFFYGVAVALTFPPYMAIFTRHVDRHKEGTEWGVYYTLSDLVGAATATIGGVVAVTIGFKQLIFGVVAASIIGVMLLWPIQYHLRQIPKNKRSKQRRRK